MSTNLFLAKRTDFATLDHLARRVGEIQDPEKVKKCREALDVLQQELGVDLRSKSDAYKYGFDATLSELVAAGSEIIGSSSHRSTNADDFLTSAKFIKYVDVVRKKGVFDGLTEGTPEYEQMMEKIKKAYLAKFEPEKPKLSPEDALKEAEALKLKGNERLQAQDYQEAVAYYDQAIEVCPNGENTYIYLSNRAAAHTHLKEFEKAASDCSAAIALRPDFAKAYSRLGHAQLSMGMLEEAKKNAERAIELDPTNGVALATLEKIKSSQKPASTSTTNRGGARPGAGMGGLGGGMGGMPGGLPDMASMMNNPMMAQMMRDPQMMQMAQQMMSDPNAMSNIMNMMGGLGRQ